MIRSRFYLIRGDTVPIYVGYTNRPIKQRFAEHKKDKDFSQYAEVTIEQIDQLDYDFTWNEQVLYQNSEEVSLREGELILHYNTQDSEYQRADAGGQTWAFEKWFVSCNKGNPKFIDMSEKQVEDYIQGNKSLKLKLWNYIANTKHPKAIKVDNYIGHSQIKKLTKCNSYIGSTISIKEGKINSYLSCTRDKNELKVNHYIAHTEEKELVKVNGYIGSSQDKYILKVNNYIRHTENREVANIEGYIEHTEDREAVKIKNYIRNTEYRELVKINGYIYHTEYREYVKINSYIGNTKKRATSI